MNIQVKEIKQDLKTLTYPWVGVSTNGTIRIFTGWRQGLGLNDTHWAKKGRFDTNVNMEYFKPFHGEITLSNS